MKMNPQRRTDGSRIGLACLCNYHCTMKYIGYLTYVFTMITWADFELEDVGLPGRELGDGDANIASFFE